MNPATRMMVAHLTKLAQSGFSYSEAATDIGTEYHYVVGMARKHSIPFPLCVRGPKPKNSLTFDARSEDMRSLYIEGQTLAAIGLKYSVTRERVRQILTKNYGIRAVDGGQSEQARKTRRRRLALLDVRSQERWGCSLQQYKSILKRPDQPTLAFDAQRKNAEHRNIGWELTLWQWWRAWQQSGHWEQRGRTRGCYVMCRQNDTGPYAVDNIYIVTCSENIQDYYVNKRAAEPLQVEAA